MTVFILMLVYVLGGQVRMETSEWKTVDACVAAGNKRVGEHVLDPLFVGGLYANCVPVQRVGI